MITLFDFTYPPLDLSDPMRIEGIPFTYYPECGALVPDDGIKMFERANEKEAYLYNNVYYPYSKRCIIGKILNIKRSFGFINGNPYDWRRSNLEPFENGKDYPYVKRSKAIIKATLRKIERDNLGIVLNKKDLQ